MTDRRQPRTKYERGQRCPVVGSQTSVEGRRSRTAGTGWPGRLRERPGLTQAEGAKPSLLSAIHSLPYLVASFSLGANSLVAAFSMRAASRPAMIHSARFMGFSFAACMALAVRRGCDLGLRSV